MKASIDQEVKNLQSAEEHRNFLEALLNDDQKTRKNSALEGQMIYLDSINLIKAENYLSLFPYPSKKLYGKDAAEAIFLVIHHAKGGLTLRKKHFKTFYKAYLNGDIHENSFSMYMTRMYDYKVNWTKSHFMKNPYTIEEQIETLAKEIGVAKEQQETLKNFNVLSKH